MVKTNAVDSEVITWKSNSLKVIALCAEKK
jgi:hypothetical protein